MRRHDDIAEAWLTWFQGVLRNRGYDLSPRGGGAVRLATETGLAQSSISRLLAGAIPSLETTVTLSRTLDIPLSTLLVRTGRASEQDFPQGEAISNQTGVLSGKPLSPEEVAIAADVPPPDREWFATMVRRLRREGDNNSTSGGAAAEG